MFEDHNNKMQNFHFEIFAYIVWQYTESKQPLVVIVATWFFLN